MSTGRRIVKNHTRLVPFRERNGEALAGAFGAYNLDNPERTFVAIRKMVVDAFDEFPVAGIAAVFLQFFFGGMLDESRFGIRHG